MMSNYGVMAPPGPVPMQPGMGAMAPPVAAPVNMGAMAAQNGGGFLATDAAPPVDKRPLNFQNLLNGGAVRVTNRANQDGTWEQDPAAGFSLGTHWYELNGPAAKTWPSNPGAHPVVADMFATRPEDIGDHKYRQILESARMLGLPDSDIYHGDAAQ